MEDDLWWKKTIDGRKPLMEDILCWKKSWKTIFDGKQPLTEIFLDQSFFNPKSFSEQKVLQTQFFFTRNFLSRPKNIFGNFFETKIFLGKKVFWVPIFSPTQIHFPTIFWTILFWITKFFRQQFFLKSFQAEHFLVWVFTLIRRGGGQMTRGKSK